MDLWPFLEIRAWMWLSLRILWRTAKDLMRFFSPITGFSYSLLTGKLLFFLYTLCIRPILDLERRKDSDWRVDAPQFIELGRCRFDFFEKDVQFLERNRRAWWWIISQSLYIAGYSERTQSFAFGLCLQSYWVYEVVGFNAVQEIDGQVSTYLPYQTWWMHVGNRLGSDLFGQYSKGKWKNLKVSESSRFGQKIVPIMTKQK